MLVQHKDASSEKYFKATLRVFARLKNEYGAVQAYDLSNSRITAMVLNGYKIDLCLLARRKSLLLKIRRQ
jgi:hypothetical protein